MFTPTLTVSAIVALSGALLLSAAALSPDDPQPPASEIMSTAQALDDSMLAVLNEPDLWKVRDLAAEVFSEDATFTMVWGPDDVDVDMDRSRIAARFTDDMTATRVGPVAELSATADADLRYVAIYDFKWPDGRVAPSPGWPGTVCSTWARGGLIYRLDCLFPEPNTAESLD